jgi:hypothetical protein
MWSSIRRCARVTVMALLVPAGGATPSAAADLAISMQDEGSLVAIRASASMNADADLAWRVLTDYPRYSEFIPGVRNCRIVRRSGGAVTVEQAGSAFLGLVPIPVVIVYEITESPPGELWSTANIPGVGTLHSHYVVKDDGAKVQLEYLGRLAPWSGALRSIEQAVVRETVTRQFQGLADEIERTATVVRSSARRSGLPNRAPTFESPSPMTCASDDRAVAAWCLSPPKLDPLPGVVGAAPRHHFIRRGDVLRRMLPQTRTLT